MPGRPGRLDAAFGQELRSHDGPHERPREINLKEILVNSPANRPEALPPDQPSFTPPAAPITFAGVASDGWGVPIGGEGRRSYLTSDSLAPPVTDAAFSPQYGTARAGYGVGGVTGPEVVWR